MSNRDDDLIMESTTDSPAQIAEGLGLELAPDPVPVDGDEPTPIPVVVEGEETPPVEADTDPEGDPVEPVPGEVTTHPARHAAPRKPAGPTAPRRAKAVDGAAAAARRTAEARLRVAEAERDAALARVREIAAGHPIGERPAPRVATTTVVTAADVPDTHPEIAAILGKVTALGAKPKQGDFADFDEFEEKKDQWIETRAILKARVEIVREDVARRETHLIADANRAADETHSAFEQSIVAAKGRHADYDEVMNRVRDEGLRISRDLGQAAMESPIGADVLYYLATHPTEMARIDALSPNRQLAEVGLIEGHLAATIRPAASAQRPTARTTRAPDPQQHLVGDLPSRGSFASRDEEMNHPSTTIARYNQLRNEMDVESGRRMTH